MTPTQTALEMPQAQVQAVEALVRTVTELSSIPAVALRAMEVTRNPDTAAVDLRVVVERDPALCARLLRCANSAAHGLSANITNLQQAISYLGFNQIRNLAMATWVSTLFTRDDAFGPYQRTKLWRHLVAVAVCARMVAKRQNVPDHQEAFLAGLLHDIGIILADQHAHDRFCTVINELRDDQTLAEIERKHLGFDHTVLGACLAEKWRFPDLVRDAIRFHHSSGQCEGEHALIVHCVEIANVICTLKGVASVGRRLIRAPSAAMTGLELSTTDVALLAAELDSELAKNEELFELWDMSDVQPFANP